MVSLSPGTLSVCYGLGINPDDPYWMEHLQIFRGNHPLVDSDDPDALSLLRDYLIIRVQQNDTPSDSVDTRINSDTDPATQATNPQEILQLFRDIGSQLRTGLSATRPRSPTPAGSFKIADPERFTGLDRKKLRPWIAHVRLKLAAERARFTTEQSKVAYALSYLSELAFQHYEPDILRGLEGPDAPIHFQSLDALLQHLDSTFGDKGSENSALREITTLSQGSTAASTYYTKFTNITPYLSWEGTAFRDIFYKGLRDEIKDELIKSPLPSTLEELAVRAIEIDNRFYERRQEMRGTNNSGASRSFSTKSTSQGVRPRAHSAPSSTKSPYHTTTDVSGATPMEIDATAPRSRLSPQEKQRRKDNGLCLYCGHGGHFATRCPVKSSQSSFQPRTKVAALSYTISTPNSHHSGSLPTEDTTERLLLD